MLKDIPSIQLRLSISAMIPTETMEYLGVDLPSLLCFASFRVLPLPTWFLSGFWTSYVLVIYIPLGHFKGISKCSEL
jgi:hypothetical protein